MYVNFGVGIASLTGTDGNAVPIAALQDFSANIKFGKKKAYGNLNFPIAVARGEGELTWKAKSIVYSGQTVAALFPGTVTTTGTITPVASEAATVPAVAGPYTVVVTHGANFDRNLSVLDVAAVTYMTKVASGPTAGQFSLDATTGTYTFAAADTGKALIIAYGYKTTGSGHTQTYSSQLMGSGSGVTLDLFNPNPNQLKPMGLRIFSTILDGFDIAMKNIDFMTNDLSGEASADSQNRVFEFYSVD